MQAFKDIFKVWFSAGSVIHSSASLNTALRQTEIPQKMLYSSKSDHPIQAVGLFMQHWIFYRFRCYLTVATCVLESSGEVNM